MARAAAEVLINLGVTCNWLRTLRVMPRNGTSVHSSNVCMSSFDFGIFSIWVFLKTCYWFHRRVCPEVEPRQAREILGWLPRFAKLIKLSLRVSGRRRPVSLAQAAPGPGWRRGE